jgi:3-hydroxyisobutyrate dehydrogenase-like beta-hydroxyacid dehydrogenase
LILDAAAEELVPMPLANLIHERLTATVAKGRENADWAGFAREVSEGAGLLADSRSPNLSSER